MDLLTITAIDRDSSDTTSRTFSTENVVTFKNSVEEFESELPYRKYELMTEELIEDYGIEIVGVLDELEVTF
jgi:hypothetical protein